MTDQLHASPTTSRRRLAALLTAGGATALALVAGRAALGESGSGSEGDGGGHDDHDDSGQGRGRGRGRGGDDDRPDDAQEAEAGEANAPAATPIPAGAALVEMFDDDTFDPSRIEVDPGQPIAFVNRDGDDHTATGSAFDTGIIPEGGGVAIVTLDVPGSYPFACRIHPEMTGVVGVRGPDGAVPAATPAATPQPGATEVRIVGFAFDPPRVEVPVGAVVAWRNDDPSPHTATAEVGAFDSDILDPGAVFSHRFDAAGAFPYRCLLHPAMAGEVVVTAG